MKKLFSINEIDAKTVSADKSEIEATRFIETHQQKIGSVNELMNRLPSPGEAFFLWTVNQFNAFTFITYLINIANNIDELVISTYSINIKIINSLSHYIRNGFIGNIYILISDYAKFRIPKVIDHLKNFKLNFPEVTIRYCWNHSKITLINCNSDFYVIEGSGNFSENTRHEQYLFLNSKKIYEFRKKCIIGEILSRKL